MISAVAERPRVRRETLIEAGEWFAAQREQRGLSQREMGRLIDVSYQSVSGYERGRTAPEDGTCERIAAVFGVTASEVRRRFGKYVPPEVDEVPIVQVSALNALLGDPDLEPDLRDHIVNQYRILRDLTQVRRAGKPSPDVARAQAEMDRWERDESASDVSTPTDQDTR